jgi:hypothetical protein
MSLSLALDRAGQKPAGKRPYFLDAEVERVLAITMVVVQELAVARERIDTLERLLTASGVIAPGAVEAFRPSADVVAERGRWTEEYIARVLRIVQQEGEAIAAQAGGDLYSEEVATELASDARA